MPRLVLTTCGAADADKLGRQPVEERLAACCNRLPGVRSTYWWQGELHTDEEVLLVFKTRDDLVDALLDRLKALHPYDLPELVVVAPEHVDAAYAAWIAGEARAT